MCNIEPNNTNKETAMRYGRLVFCNERFGRRMKERALTEQSFADLYNEISYPETISAESVRLWLRGANAPNGDKYDVIKKVLGIPDKSWWRDEGSIFKRVPRLAS